MKKLWWVLGLAAALALAPAACGDDDEGNGGSGGTGGTGGGEGGTGGGEGGTGGGEGGTGGGEGGTGGGEPQLIEVSGKVQINPIAAAYYSGTGGTPPAFEAMLVRVVDPVKAKAGDPEAMLGETANIAEDGSFTITDVDVSQLSLGMVITVDDDEAAAEDDFFAASTMGVCQPASACQQGDISDATAFVVPMEVVTAIGAGSGLADLLTMERGFILGLAFEPPATPLADVAIGVTGAPVEPAYLSETFAVEEEAVGTTASGIFLFEHTDAIMTLTPTKADYEFMPASQQAGTTPGVVFQVFFVGSPSGG